MNGPPTSGDDERRARLLTEIAALYPEPGEGSRFQRGDAVARTVIAGLLVLAGVAFDLARIIPGPWYYIMLVFWAAPPWVRARLERRDEQTYKANRDTHLEALSRSVHALPDVEIVARLAALAQREHGGRITGVMQVVQSMTSLPGESSPLLEVQSTPAQSATPPTTSPLNPPPDVAALPADQQRRAGGPPLSLPVRGSHDKR